MKDLHLYFYDSNNRKTHDIIKNVREDVTGSEVRDLMEKIVMFDQPTKSGLRRYERIAAAKLVETVVTVLFVNHEKPVKTATTSQVTVAEATAAWLKKHTPQAPKEEVITQTELSLTEMTRFSALKIATIMLNDVKENSNEAIPRYLSNLMHLQCMNELRPYGDRIGTTYFTPVLVKMYAIRNWTEEMVVCLPYLKKFFSAPQWSEVLAHYPDRGREVAARLAGSPEAPDYPAVDAYLAEITAIAAEELATFKGGRDQIKDQILALKAQAV